MKNVSTSLELSVPYNINLAPKTSKYQKGEKEHFGCCFFFLNYLNKMN